MEKTINYKWTANYDESQPDNNFSCENESIELGDAEYDLNWKTTHITL